MKGYDAFSWAVTGGMFALAGYSLWRDFQTQQQDRHSFLIGEINHAKREISLVSAQLCRVQEDLRKLLPDSPEDPK